MAKRTYENNQKGPFSPSKGSTHNATCPVCKTPTWFCEDPNMTMHVGHRMIDRKGNTVGVLDLSGNVFCEECYPNKEEIL